VVDIELAEVGLTAGDNKWKLVDLVAIHLSGLRLLVVNRASMDFDRPVLDMGCKIGDGQLARPHIAEGGTFVVVRKYCRPAVAVVVVAVDRWLQLAAH
jgi:hypothetical protein